MSDATAELNARREQYLAGRLTRSEYLAHAERLGIGAEPDDAVRAQVKLAEIRQQRIERRITESDFLAESERLGPIAWPPAAS